MISMKADDTTKLEPTYVNAYLSPLRPATTETSLTICKYTLGDKLLTGNDGIFPARFVELSKERFGLG